MRITKTDRSVRRSQSLRARPEIKSLGILPGEAGCGAGSGGPSRRAAQIPDESRMERAAVIGKQWNQRSSNFLLVRPVRTARLLSVLHESGLRL